jgi:hypothetical protein
MATTLEHAPIVRFDAHTAPHRAAWWLSLAIVVLTAAVSAAGLWIAGLYHEGEWAKAALRGGDLVSLVLAVPLLVVALLGARRGSLRAEALWAGMLLYTAYNFAYYAFGATFNAVFLAHIALLAAGVIALALLLPRLDAVAMADAFRGHRLARAIGWFLVVVGALQGALWVFVIVRNAITGELIRDIPVDGQHLVFALDLGLLVPGLVIGGFLLARGRPFGAVLGTGMTVMGAAYQVNLMMAGVFADAADVVGAKAFPLESIVLTAAFVAAAIALLRLLPGGRVSRR